MPREPMPFKREYKGDVVINISDIFRNPETQKEVMKECSKLKKNKDLKQEEQCVIHDVSDSDDVDIYIIDPNTVNYNPYEDRC